MLETVSGLIERVTFHNPENGFAVLKVRVRGHRDPITVVGNVTSVSAGEQLEASGRWDIDRNHGRQFQAQRITTSHPASAEGIERYLASGAVRSIGPQLASRIVALYKERTLEIFSKSPDFLLHIPGIGPKRLKRIRESWLEQEEVRKIMLFFSEYGIGGGQAIRIYRAYGQQAIATIKENPYQLADDIRGIGFKTADQLAERLGVDRQSPYRARAAVRYSLHQLAQRGHVGYPEDGVVEETTRLVEIDIGIVRDAVESELQQQHLVREIVDGEPWLYLMALYRAEVGLAAAAVRLASVKQHPLPEIRVEVAIDWVQQRLQLRLADAQQEAIRQVCHGNLVVVTGGPGVGKTTLVRSILEIFQAKGLKCVLCAPTGRAAKRLAETTGQRAATVHRLLEFDPATGDFKRNQERPLRGDLFVLDEASMVDVVLGYQFLRAVPSGACVVLVGDVDQLPSVGPGTVLADMIHCKVLPVVRLTEVFRQAQESRIIRAAYDINRGQLPDLAPDDKADFFFIEAEEPEAVEDLLVRLVRDRIPQRFGFDPRADIQVLAPMNRSQLGGRNLNQVLQAALNAPADSKAEVARYGWLFRVGDRVLQTENNYDRDVFNGDLGIIQKVNRVEQVVTVQFEGRDVDYDYSDLDELALAYVLTIHKSQGSEYPCVVVPLHTQHYMMLQRNLLYTAVTRGRRLVVVVGSRRALSLAVAQQDTRRRCSALRHRIAEQF